jgi:amino acid permease
MLDSGILYSLHSAELSGTARGFLALTFLFVMFSCLSSFQIFSMPVFDMMEQLYTGKWNKKCNPYIRLITRSVYVLVVFFVAIAFPFLLSLAGLIGGLNSIPVTFAIPCLMWLKIRRPDKGSFTWYLNWFLAIFGMVMSGLITAAGVGVIIQRGFKLEFFKPHA